jgi:hypothetical protein
VAESTKSDHLRRVVLGIGLAVGAALLVWLPRLTDLGGYLIIDEADRWRWAESFYRALIAGDPRATLIGDGYPGIVPVWLETIWLLAESVRRSILEGQWFSNNSVYMLFHVWSRTEYLAQQRLPVALFNGLLTLLVGLYAGNLYGRRVGILALIFVALNPFYLADSRVNRAEAIITGLLTLAMLALVDYGRTQRLRTLLVSGALGGLALLTKIQGVVILPAVGVSLWLANLAPRPPLYVAKSPAVSRMERGGRGVRFVSAAALWLLAAGLTWCVLWPAMWVRPLDVLSLVYDYAAHKAGAEGVNVFFAGQHFFQQDPGLLFYPVVAVLRTTPLTMIGLLLAVVEGVRRLGSTPAYRHEFWRGRTAPLVIFVTLYALAMSIGSHKQDRYLMPIFLALDILAALGWAALWDHMAGRWPSLRRAIWKWAGITCLLVVQLISALPYHPYYFPYFNPLVGDGEMGARMLRVGWGEGMDQVAQYLNRKPNAASLTVAARWYRYMLDFAGKTLPFDQRGLWTRADYMVLYIQQTQRMIDPSPGVIRYFQRLQPEHVVSLNGIAYAHIYPTPFTRAAQPSVSQLPGQAALFGYRWEAASPTTVRVVWENQRPDGNTTMIVAAVTDGRTAPAWQPCVAATDFEAATATPGEVVESVCDLAATAARLPAGAYDLRVAVRDPAGEITEFLFPEAWQSLLRAPDGGWRVVGWPETLDAVARRDIPETATPTDRFYDGQIRLAGYGLSATTLNPGQSLGITLYWQALEPLPRDYTVFNHMFGLDGAQVGQADEAPSVSTSRWLPGQVFSTSHLISTSPDLAVPMVATLDVGLYDPEGDNKALPITNRQGRQLPASLTRIKVVPTAWPDQPPPLVDEVRFGDALLLEGHADVPSAIRAGGAEALEIKLWWQARDRVDADFAVFVHLVDAAHNIVAQGDGIPVQGRYPTSVWAPGERILDVRRIALPVDLPAGRYGLLVGMYNPTDGSRLPIYDTKDDSLSLGQLQVVN